MKRHLFYIFISALSLNAFAQEDSTAVVRPDSVVANEEPIPYSALNRRGWENQIYSSIDSVNSTFNHRELNEWSRDLYGQLTMGNLSTPLVNHIYQHDDQVAVRPGFQSYFNGWGSARDLPFYDVKAPVSGIRYYSGYTLGQLFGGYFTANLNERTNLFLDYQRVNARGDYFSQDNLHDRLQLTGHYRTHNNRYSIQAASLWNKNRGRESGGITDLDGFANPDSLVTTRELIDIRWGDAEFKARQFELDIAQEYLPFADSTARQGIGLYHDGHIGFYDRTFTSEDTLLGNNFLAGPTTDSNIVRIYDQQVGLVFQSGWKGFSYVRAGIGFRSGTMANDSLSHAETSSFLSGEVKGETPKFEWGAKGRFYYVGTQAGAFDLEGAIAADIKGFKIQGEAVFQNASPSFQNEHWLANDFIWDNDFSAVLYQRVGGRVGYSDWVSAGVKVHNWTNPIYYNTNALPEQYNGTMQLLQADVQFIIPVLSWLTIDSRTTFQGSTTAEDILRLPTLFNRTGMFFKWEIFNGALKAYTGVEGTFFSKYKANAYMPITGVFHLQDDQEIGDFVYLNAVAGFEIGSARVYVVAENVAEGLTNRAYYAAPYYPMADRTFHLGLNWRFFN